MEKEKRNNLISGIYGAFYIAVTLALGALFIWGILDLYFKGAASGGEVIFTREGVADKLSTLLIPVLVWVLASIGAFVLSLLFPVRKKRSKPSDEYLYMRSLKRVPLENKSDARFAGVAAYEKQKLYIRIALSAIGLAVFIYCVVFLAIPENFPKTDVTAEIIRMIKFLFPFIALFGVLCYGVAVYEGIRASKLLSSVRALACKAVQAKEGLFERIFGGEKVVFWSRISLAVIAVVFIIAGTVNGGLHDVLIKAINICTECIGLG